MTKAEILLLVPGPYLNDLVAEHVMGYLRTYVNFGNGPNDRWHKPDMFDGYYSASAVSPPFSEEPKFMWEMIEHVTRLQKDDRFPGDCGHAKHCLHMGVQTGNTPDICVASFVDLLMEEEMGMAWQREVECKTIPEAVCKSALFIVFNVNVERIDNDRPRTEAGIEGVGSRPGC